MRQEIRFFLNSTGLYLGSLLIGLSVHAPCEADPNWSVVAGVAIFGVVIAGWSWYRLGTDHVIVRGRTWLGPPSNPSEMEK